MGNIAITAILKAKPSYENDLFDALKQVVQPANLSITISSLLPAEKDNSYFFN